LVTTPRRAVTKRTNPHPLTQAGDDAALVTSAAAGDADALERLLMRAQEAAWRFSTSVCGHADDAEDAMQEALIKTYRYASRIREPEAFRPWLYRTVRNACLMSRRKRAGEPSRLQSIDELLRDSAETAGARLPHPGRDPEQLAGNAALQRRLHRALRALPPAYRAIVFLREMEGLSTREVASALGISEDSVKTRLHRARLALQTSLAEVKP
jgi:RNA polymerase sigma-70 factor (ECF subfamily)